MTFNEEIKKQARAERIPMWRIAEQAGVSENTLGRWLRVPLEGEHRERVTAALQRLIERQEGRDSSEAR